MLLHCLLVVEKSEAFLISDPLFDLFCFSFLSGSLRDLLFVYSVLTLPSHFIMICLV